MKLKKKTLSYNPGAIFIFNCVKVKFTKFELPPTQTQLSLIKIINNRQQHQKNKINQINTKHKYINLPRSHLIQKNILIFVNF